ncbi:MAG: adenylyltransferase/cytidyltransferase family protein [Actinomycetota bacterium]|nr:adenylyltransferase/cytidyltransferase family protein [Actinomycetota bacterium]
MAILTIRDVPDGLRALREGGGRIVFTNDCFDLLHPGHVAYLEEARSLGDALVVGLNSDKSVRGLGKGPDRPIVAERDRAAVLAALRAVDAVVVFDERTPVRLMREVRPAVYVKGGDYRIEDLPEAGVAREIGTEVEIISLSPATRRALWWKGLDALRHEVRYSRGMPSGSSLFEDFGELRGS